MACINKADIAFAYECKFSDLVKLIHGTEFKVVPTKAEVVYVTGINVDNFVTYETRMLLAPNTFNKLDYAKLLIELDSSLQGLRDIANERSRIGLLEHERTICPIYRFKKNIPYMHEIGAQPWHHLLFIGQYVYLFIWDTRVVEKVLTIEETAGLSTRMLRLANDNNMPIVFAPGTEQYTDYICTCKPTLHPCIRACSVIDELNEGGYDITSTEE